MAKSRAPAAGNGEERTEDGGFRSQGAPRGFLHFYALMSIAHKPMRGYDLMKEIEMKTEGAWRPGPGAVYPVLQKLAKQGYIMPKKKSGDGPTQVLYEITPEGLRNIASAKKAMRSSTERWSLMSSLFIDLMEPDDLVRFVTGFIELQIEMVHTIVESERSKLSDQDKLFILRQYRLNLERELSRAISSITELDRRTRTESEAAARGALEGGP